MVSEAERFSNYEYLCCSDHFPKIQFNTRNSSGEHVMSLEESLDDYHGAELFEQFELTMPPGYKT